MRTLRITFGVSWHYKIVLKTRPLSLNSAVETMCEHILDTRRRKYKCGVKSVGFGQPLPIRCNYGLAKWLSFWRIKKKNQLYMSFSTCFYFMLQHKDCVKCSKISISIKVSTVGTRGVPQHRKLFINKPTYFLRFFVSLNDFIEAFVPYLTRSSHRFSVVVVPTRIAHCRTVTQGI